MLVKFTLTITEVTGPAHRSSQRFISEHTAFINECEALDLIKDLEWYKDAPDTKFNYRTYFKENYVQSLDLWLPTYVGITQRRKNQDKSGPYTLFQYRFSWAHKEVAHK